MAKENLKEYFRHDYHARDHLKFKQLRMKLGLEGMGIYWCLVEMLYEEGGTIDSTHYDSIAYDLRINKELLIKVIQDYNLFECDAEKFSSKKVVKRLKERSEKSKKAAKAIKLRWNRLKAKDTNVLQTNNDRNTIIEENRIEENRIEENNKIDNNNKVAFAPPAKSLDERKNEFYAKLVPFTGQYTKEMLREFFDYWAESNENGKKMLWEMKKTFHIPGRLSTWSKRQKTFHRKPITSHSGKLQ